MNRRQSQSRTFRLTNSLSHADLVICVDAAMQFATSTAALAVPKIIATLDPEKEADTTMEAILTALTVGLPFLSLPAVGALVPAATGAAGTLFVTALQQAPSVTEAIWKSDGESTQVVQMGELASELDELSGKVGEMLDRGLAIIMRDVSTFAKFASSGSFSGPDAISIPKETAKLDLAFKAHLVTKAMSANDCIMVRQTMLMVPGPTAHWNPTPRGMFAIRLPKTTFAI